jgi:ABC-type Fe3+/spermidine/putrescine transport system ATPase subunit
LTEAASSPSPAADVEVVGLRKAYGTVEAVAGVDFEVPAGSFFTLLGPSGSGKTTTLRRSPASSDPTAAGSA